VASQHKRRNNVTGHLVYDICFSLDVIISCLCMSLLLQSWVAGGWEAVQTNTIAQRLLATRGNGNWLPRTDDVWKHASRNYMTMPMHSMLRYSLDCTRRSNCFPEMRSKFFV